MNSRSLLSRLQLPTYDRNYLATLPKDTGQRTRTNGRARGRGDSKAVLVLHGRSHVPTNASSAFSDYQLAGLVRSNVAVCVAV